MLSLQTKRKRFNLLHLQEDEIYTKEFSCEVEYDDFANPEVKRTEPGKIHVCSRSLIFEPDKTVLNIYKFMFRDMTGCPVTQIELDAKDSLGDSNINKLLDRSVSKGATGDLIVFKTKKVVEVNVQGVPSPHKVIEMAPRVISIRPLFEKVSTILSLVNRLFNLFQSNATTDTDDEVHKIILGDIKNVRFNTSYLESVSEKLILKSQVFVRRILPMVNIYGILYVTNANVYFQTLHTVASKPIKRLAITDITELYRRRFEQKQIGIELTSAKKTYFFAFDAEEQREEVYQTLLKKVKAETLTETSLEKLLIRWQNREISNFEYLMHLNFAAYRSFSDLTQYPVFPWIIIDYENPTIDLNDTRIFRDLTKPIGALNPKRLHEYQERFKEMSQHKFLYGTHYSTPGYVIGYLVRNHPEYMLKLQSGRFDKPDRLFWGIRKDWNNCINNPAIVKELIPQFYMEDDSFLVNYLKLDLGIRQNGKRVDDVKLPKWAKNAKEYLAINRAALESEYVSAHLHYWIDLIFGYKQRGPQAIESDNVFHYLTYEGMVDLDSVTDQIERKGLRVQINEFGQTPKQLFRIPHPSRFAGVSPFNGFPGSPVKTEEESKENYGNIAQSSIQEDNQHRGNVKKETIWDPESRSRYTFSGISKVHKSLVSYLHFLEGDEDKVVSGGHDGYLKVVDLAARSVGKSFKVCDLAISCGSSIRDEEVFAVIPCNSGLRRASLEVMTITCTSSISTMEAQLILSWQLMMILFLPLSIPHRRSFSLLVHGTALLSNGKLEMELLTINMSQRQSIMTHTSLHLHFLTKEIFLLLEMLKVVFIFTI
eukprot:TRINITY_DN7572_c0_g3_i1.p1 TRINITY_DN7572_c0_g3~~TRINITY_DN7572_c0_g3_i1.p1  ORF type:complete len:822 (+),score=154.42 TRINITY_DN7572_c0_g3_i1:59-2524(+)